MRRSVVFDAKNFIRATQFVQELKSLGIVDYECVIHRDDLTIEIRYTD